MIPNISRTSSLGTFSCIFLVVSSNISKVMPNARSDCVHGTTGWSPTTNTKSRQNGRDSCVRDQSERRVAVRCPLHSFQDRTLAWYVLHVCICLGMENTYPKICCHQRFQTFRPESSPQHSEGVDYMSKNSTRRRRIVECTHIFLVRSTLAKRHIGCEA